MGDDEISNEFREKLQKNADDFQSIVNKILSQHVKVQGWLTITFVNATADILASNTICDSLPGNILCDSYIKFYTNNEMVAQTSVVWNEKYPYIGKTFITPKISMEAPITIEMLDYDSATSSDMILSWNTNVRELLNDGELYTVYGIGENKIVTKSSWTEEPIQFTSDEEKTFYNEFIMNLFHDLNHFIKKNLSLTNEIVLVK